LEGLDSLKCLYLGKNKITKIQNLDSLKTLEVLSLQVGGTAVVTLQYGLKLWLIALTVRSGWQQGL